MSIPVFFELNSIQHPQISSITQWCDLDCSFNHSGLLVEENLEIEAFEFLKEKIFSKTPLVLQKKVFQKLLLLL